MHFSPKILLSVIALATGGAVLAHGLRWQPEIPRTEVAASPLAQLPIAARTPDSQDAARLEALRQRPPFTPGRQPYKQSEATETAAVSEEKVPSSLPQVPEVRGTATSGGSAVAIILDPESSRLRRLVVGDEVGGWTVQEILSDRVRFTTDQADAVAYSRRPGEDPRSEVKPRTVPTQAADAGLPPGDGKNRGF